MHIYIYKLAPLGATTLRISLSKPTAAGHWKSTWYLFTSWQGLGTFLIASGRVWHPGSF